ncbi:MAG: 50S ribosomal protein L23 [Euryarchaeota archaeon]|nr:50S ribosomal protein L23 [Euryarchaeota archaeon]
MEVNQAPHDIVHHPFVTEKTMAAMERSGENALVFVVRKDASKSEIKWAVEKLFAVKVEHVRTKITMRGEKLAHVKFTPEFKADEIATRTGVF